MGCNVCLTSKKNCPSKGWDDSSLVIHVLLIGLILPLLQMPSLTKTKRSPFNLLYKILFAHVSGSTFILTFFGSHQLSRQIFEKECSVSTMCFICWEATFWDVCNL